MTAPTPAVVSEHDVSSVTAAVEMAKSRSAAGAFSFLRPKRTSPRPKALRLLRRRAGSGLGVAGTDLCLQLLELAVHLRRRGDLRQLAVELRLVARRQVLERARARELVDGGCPGLQFLGLVLRTLDRRARVVHPPADAGRRLADAHLRLRCGVLRLEDFLLRAERLDLRLQLLLGADELVLLVGEPLDLVVHALQLLLRDRLALERLPREVLAVRRDRLTGLRLELDDVLLELLLLELEALLRGDDVRDAALDVLELLEHLLVRVVERLGRILRPVEQLRVLRLDDQRCAGQEAGHVSVSLAPVLVARSMHPDWLSNAYVVADAEGGTAVFVDAGADPAPLVAAVEGWGAKPAVILRTHAHHDHVAFEDELRERFGVPVVAEPGEWDFGGTHVRGVATPGHSDDMVAFVAGGELVFTGDTLFKDAVGGGDPGAVRASVMDVFMALPDAVR